MPNCRNTLLKQVAGNKGKKKRSKLPHIEYEFMYMYITKSA